MDEIITKETEIMKKPFIHHAYLDLIPRHSENSRQTLKNDIEVHGLQVDIEVSKQTGRIVDGMTREAICKELKIKQIYKYKNFKDEAAEIEYVISSNLKRRQLGIFQQVELLQTLRSSMMAAKKAEHGKLQSQLKNGDVKPKPLKERRKTSTPGRIASMLDCGLTLILQCHYIIDHGTEEEKQKVRVGLSAIRPMYTHIIKRRRLENTDSSTISAAKLYPSCMKCDADMHPAKKCHVHSNFCCTKCTNGF